MWTELLAVMAGVITLVTLFFKWYLAQQTPEKKALDDEKARRTAGDSAITALEARDLEAVRKNVTENIDRLEAADAVRASD